MADAVGRFDAIKVGHLYVHQHQVRAMAAIQGDRLAAARGFRDQAKSRRAGQHAGDALPEDRMIVCRHHRNRSLFHRIAM
jgi:hypothetical protein